MFSAMDKLGSGMTASQAWMDVTGNNITNMNTTRTTEGGPYQRQSVLFKEAFKENGLSSEPNGVEVDKIVKDPNVELVYDPSHPDANQEGYVAFPAIDLAAEMSNMIMASRGYEANVTAFNNVKTIMEKINEIGNV